MKKLWCIYLAVTIIFASGFIVFNLTNNSVANSSYSNRNIAMNRIATLIEEEYKKNGDIESSLDSVYFDKEYKWKNEYDNSFLPENINFVSALKVHDNVNNLLESGENQAVWILYDDSDNMLGFLIFLYHNTAYSQTAVIVNACIIVCFLVVITIILYIYIKILKPFNEFSKYPERLSKGEFASKIPETKNRNFGKFVWSLNMLGDKIDNDQKRINRLTKERQTFITTIAHGVKTPVANIKLYANAIETGLYREDGIPDKSDSEIAVKIDKNADDISNLVTDIIKTSSEGLIDFIPEIQPFYANEIKDFAEEEYSNRLSVLRIPYEIEALDKTIIQSDKNGIARILSQLIENAIKYGDGTGIYIKSEKLDDGHYFTVRNKGEKIPENEVAYMFTSFWRGSNSSNTEGNGLGLFEAKQITKRLSGDISVRYIENTKETEFVLFIP